MDWQHPATSGAVGLTSLDKSSTIPLSSSQGSQQAKLLFPAYLCKQTHKYPKSRQLRHGEHSATGRHKTSINQCQPWAFTHALLSAQPLNHSFSLAVNAATNTDLPVSPCKGGREKGGHENNITLYSLEKAGCYKTTETMRGHVGR